MPLVPRFELSQTSSEVTVLVFVATIRLDSIEVLLDEESVLHFHAHPYSLTLNFAPHEFESDAEGIVSAQYDPSKQTIRIPLIKANKGVTWPNLEMTARLLRPKEIPKQWLHAVSSSTNSTPEVEDEQMDTVNLSKFGYGFGNLFQNIFTDYCRSGVAQEMLSLPDPENTEPSKRRSLRVDQELEDFDPDRYDYSIEDDYLYPLVMDFVPFWKKRPKSADQTKDCDSLVESFQDQLSLSPFTSDEQLLLSTIPYPLIPKPMLEDGDHQDRLWCGLLDLLVPYVYDHITSMGEPTVESAWTVTQLSSSLSWLDPPETPREALVSLTRRMVIYPYWRNVDFCTDVWEHVLFMLEQGAEGLHLIVKSLLQLRSILEKSEFYYAGNKLFVDPYLYWVQHQNAELLQLASSLRAELNKGTLRDDVDLKLAVFERLALGEDGSNSETSSEDSDDSTSGSDDDGNSEEEEETVEIDSTEIAQGPIDVASPPNDISSALLDSEEAGDTTSKLFNLGSEDGGATQPQQETSASLIQVITD
jgi:protein SHQ1